MPSVAHARFPVPDRFCCTGHDDTSMNERHRTLAAKILTHIRTVAHSHIRTFAHSHIRTFAHSHIRHGRRAAPAGAQT